MPPRHKLGRKLVTDELDIKLKKLEAVLQNYNELAIALSCSDENAFLSHYGSQVLGNRVFALMADAAIFALDDKHLCQHSTRSMNMELFCVPTREMHELDFLENSPRRCYYCRRYILGTLVKTARRFGIEDVAVGLTVDAIAAKPWVVDALKELDVDTPLAEAGLTTADIEIIKERFNVKLPAMGRCMAERVPCGMPLDNQTLQFLAGAEAFLAEHGFAGSRVDILTEDKVIITLPAGALYVDVDADARREVVAYMQANGYEIMTWKITAEPV